MVERPTVLITGLGSYGEQVLKALKHPDAVSCRIIGADIDPYNVLFDMADEAVAIPRADSPDFVEALLRVSERFAVAAIFPGCEADLDRLVAARDEIERRGIRLMAAPTSTIAICRDKVVTAETLRALGFDPPRYAVLSDASEISAIDWYPVVVKPRRAGGGSKDCYIAQSPRELQLLLELVGDDAGLFVQEYVGMPDNEFTVGVLLDIGGNLINSIALRRDLVSQLNVKVVTKNRTGHSRFGNRLVISSGVSQGEVGAFVDVTDFCERLALAIGAAGAINIQCRRVDGKIKVFEINPRFSGTTFIRAMMGYNEPDVLVRWHLLGERIAPRFAYRHGHVVRSLRESLVSDKPAQSWRN